MMLFSHGVNSVGAVPIERWKKSLALAKNRGVFIGIDEKAYRDFATFIRYDNALRAEIRPRVVNCGQLSVDSLNQFFWQSSASLGRLTIDVLNR